MTAFARWRVVPRMLVDTTERDLGVGALRPTARESRCSSPPIGVLSVAHADADLAVARAAARAARHPDPQHPGLGPHGGRRRGPSAGRATGTSSTGAATTTSSRASSREPRRAAARPSSSRSTRHTSAGVHATSTSGTCPSPAARASRSTPPTRCSSGSSRERVAARPRPAPTPSPQPRPTPAAVRTLVSMSRNHPGDTRRNLTAPEPRAAVETFLDVFSQPVADVGRPATAARADEPADRAQGRSCTPTTRVAPSTRESTASTCPTTADGRSTGRSRRSTRCPGSWRRFAARARMRRLFDSGVRSRRRRLRGARARSDAVGIGRPHVYGLALAGAEGVAEVLRNIRAELDLTMALTGCRTLADVTRDRLVEAPRS